MTFKNLNPSISFVAICLLSIDFFIVDEFKIELIYFVILCSLLILNVTRLIVKYNTQKVLFGLIINIGIIGFLLFNTYVLAILSFGVGFTGRTYPLIMGLSVLINSGFIIVSFQESKRLITKKDKMIRIEESLQDFMSALSRFDESKLKLNDEDLGYEIFEELDIEYHTFLDENTVNRLIDAGLIPALLKNRILNLRENIRPIMEGKHEVHLYRNDPDWKELREEANSIRKEINQAIK